MKFSIAQDLGEIVKVTIDGALNHVDISPPLDPFRQILGNDAYKRIVLLDMGQSNYLDSLCIGWLLSTNKRFRETGGQLVLHSLQPTAANVITLLRLNSVFQVASDSEKAMQMVKGEVA